MNEEREEKDALVHHHSLMGTNALRPGQPTVMRKESLKISPGRFKSNWARLWVIRDIKVDGRIEIEAPYSRRTKLVTSAQLKLYRCEVGKEHTKSTTNLKRLTRQARDVKQALPGRQPSALNSF